MHASVEIRVIGEDDIVWMGALCSKRYQGKFDEKASAAWLRRTVFPNDRLFRAVRTNQAFAISRMDYAPWFPDDPEVSVQLACADHGHMLQLLKLLRDSVDWAKSRNAAIWRCCSDTEYRFDGIARLMGAEEIQPRFVMRLR